MGTLLDWLLSSSWEWLLGKLGMSTDQKLGRAQIENQDLTANLKEKTYEAEVFEAPDRPESVVLDDMLKHAGK